MKGSAGWECGNCTIKHWTLKLHGLWESTEQITIDEVVQPAKFKGEKIIYYFPVEPQSFLAGDLVKDKVIIHYCVN